MSDTTAPAPAEKKLDKRMQQVAAESAPDADTGIKGPRLVFIFIALVLAMFVSSLSETIDATALPTIVGDLGGVELMQWVTTGYILTQCIMMPVYGKLGDVMGRKYLIIIAIILYTLGKVGCIFAMNMYWLIACRAFAGLGGGGLVILSQAIIADVTSPRDRGKYLGIMGATFGVATIVGPVVGGWVVEVTTWRAVFLFTIPFAIIAVIGCAVFLPKPKPVENKPKLDIPGFVLIAAAVSSLVLISAWVGTTYPIDSPVSIALIVVCIASWIGLYFVEKHSDVPILPVFLFRNKNFVIVTLTGMLIFISLMGTVNYLPTYLQIVHGMEPMIAGLSMIPMMIGMLITSMSTGFIASNTGHYKWMLLAMCVVTGVGFFLMSTIQPTTSVYVIMFYLFVTGFGLGIGSQILVLVVQNEFSSAIVGTATAANNFFRQLASTLGASVVGTLFTSRLAADLAGKIPASVHVSVDDITPTLVDKLPEAVRHIIQTGYSDALVPLFLWFVPLMVAGLILCFFVKETPLATTINHGGDTSDDD
jgi:EmrB/QacA subfamily drug resistance transporter